MLTKIKSNIYALSFHTATTVFQVFKVFLKNLLDSSATFSSKMLMDSLKPLPPKKFLLYFCEKKSLAEILLIHAEEKWLCTISSFYEKRKTK